MRCFIAIQLTPPLKQALGQQMTQLSSLAQGRFTREENLHITLAFLGETTRVSALKEAMQAVQGERFVLQLQSLGRFKRREGEILWRGVGLSKELLRLQKELSEQLKARGFPLEEREFRPHLTLGRQVVWNPGASRDNLSSPPLSMEVTAFSLMQSQRVGGRLVYTEVFRRELGPAAPKQASEKGASHRAPAKRDGRCRRDIHPGQLVDIVLKKDQPTGKLTRGHVLRILTNSATHPHGIKVMLREDAQVGRVQNIVED